MSTHPEDSPVTTHSAPNLAIANLESWLPSANNTMVNYFTKRDRVTDDGSQYRNGVLVYLHLNKAAGSTTKACLRTVSGASQRRMGPVQDSNGRVILEGRLSSTNGGQYSAYGIMMGGYAFGICDAMKDRKCSYFTIVRDPYERVLSSYSYCRRAGMDQTCRGLGPWDVSLKEWAVHQGSYFFKQLLMKSWFCTANERTHPEFKDLSDIPHSKTTSFSSTPCWLREKIILKKSLTPHEWDTLIRYCVDHLEDWFAMVGLTDQYDLSLAMLEDIYNVPFYQKCASTKKWNSSDYKNLVSNNIATNKTETIRDLMGNSQVNEALKADILLYEKALEIFERQKTSFLGDEKENT